MLRAGLALLTVFLGICWLPLNAKADGGSKDDACPLQTDWIPQPYPLDGDNKDIFVPAVFRGKSVRASVDTGATWTTFNLEFAQRAGFRLGAESRLKAIGGNVTFAKLDPVDLTLAGSSLHLETAGAT